MKNLHYTFILIFIILTCSTMNVISQSLKNMPKAKRDSVMLDAAKKAILEFGDERYYTEHINVKINREIIDDGPYKGCVNYVLTYEYDDTKYLLEWDLAEVIFSENTGEILYIKFGNGSVILKKDMDAYREGVKKNKPIEKVPFETFPRLK